MKDCCIAGLRIGEYLADSLTGTDLIACLYIDLAQVTIDCQIVTVTDDHRIVVTGHYEYTGHFTVEYRAGISSRCRLDVDTAVVGADVFEFRVLLFAEGTDNGIAS
jgi:hypothetical protein